MNTPRLYPWLKGRDDGSPAKQSADAAARATTVQMTAELDARLNDVDIPENVAKMLRLLIGRGSLPTALTYVDGAFDMAIAFTKNKTAQALWKLRGALKREEVG